ncbi:MAG: TetR/AcrR family transcriptional regulator [Candidatus Omnitrophica bacterium]|nr:TetR/AcrR family transcriptional regulator [Candidatus Omnitrophota bacterium]
MNVDSLIEETLLSGRSGSPMNRKERDRQLRKSDILQAAERVFALKGYHNAAMQDIAREAQYATGTVYLYFKDKEMLYFSLLEEKIRNLTATLKENTAQVADAEEKLRIFVQESLNSFEKNQDFFRIFFSERTKGQILKEGKISKSSVMLQHKEFVEELINIGQKQKVIRNDFSAKQIADIFGSIFMTVIFDWLKEGPKNRKLNAMADFILDIFLSGAGKKR